MKNKLSKLEIAYRTQKYNADRRGIEWLFTFDIWCQKWSESNKFELRGCTLEKPYQMCRYNDTGPYSYENTYIGTTQQNANDRRLPTQVTIKNPVGRPIGSCGKMVEIYGVTYNTITEASKKTGIPRTTILARIKKGLYKYSTFH